MSSRRSASRIKRIYPYLAPDLRDRLAKYCVTTHSTESAVVRAALEQYLDGTADFALFLRRIDRLARGLDHLQRDQELLSQCLNLFVRLWLAHTPRLPRDERAAAQASAEERYKQFLEHVTERFASGKRFIDDLPQERIADDEELAAAAGHLSDSARADKGQGPDGTPVPS